MLKYPYPMCLRSWDAGGLGVTTHAAVSREPITFKVVQLNVDVCGALEVDREVFLPCRDAANIHSSTFCDSGGK